MEHSYKPNNKYIGTIVLTIHGPAMSYPIVPHTKGNDFRVHIPAIPKDVFKNIKGFVKYLSSKSPSCCSSHTWLTKEGSINGVLPVQLKVILCMTSFTEIFSKAVEKGQLRWDTAHVLDMKMLRIQNGHFCQINGRCLH